MENCWLYDLADLAQEHDFVESYLLLWIKRQVLTFGLDGIRIDTVPLVPQWFWNKYANAAGVFQMGEVSTNDTEYLAPYQMHLTAVLNYPMYYVLKDVFQN